MTAPDSETDTTDATGSPTDTDDPVEAPPGPLEALLVVQHHDTRIDQLRHQIEHLPARAEIVARQAELVAIDGEVADITARREDLARSQRRLEDEIAAVEKKAASDEKALYGGAVTGPRELQDLQHEIESLRRRQSTLEDDVLELMEAIEPLDAQLDELGQRRDDVEQRCEAARRELTIQEAELSVELEAEESTRASLTGGLDVALVDEYTKLRAQLGGVGVARLEGGRCLGCQLALSAVERDRIRSLPTDAMLHCEECGRLLVR